MIFLIYVIVELLGLFYLNFYFGICFGVSLMAAGPRFPNTRCVILTALRAVRQLYKASLWESWNRFCSVVIPFLWLFLFASAYRSWPLGLASPTLAV
ncbi:MAG: hypothetical protein U0Y10_04640 [Spirosomataceae bacterium]